MSVAYFIVTEREIDGFDPFVNGKSVGRLSDKKLERLCEAAGVAPLQQFLSQNPDELADFLHDEGIEYETLPSEEWYEASVGLDAVNTLIAYLQGESEAFPDKHNVIEDLQEFSNVFVRLQEEGVKWHLAIDF